MLRVQSSLAAEQFYCRGLGFTLLSSWPAADTPRDPRYLTLTRDAARLHVHSFPAAGAGTGAVYVFVADVDALHGELLSRGVPVTAPLDQEWRVREIVVRDPDGNVVTFGQRRD
ncbi:MAG TPA: glyoxalase superfamily protein [Gemmatimonadales bacterium]|nr:glyoxalase superfamily protein [Gemmatimonadales bacterium]